MLFSTTVILLPLLASLLVQPTEAQCQVRPRREWHSLTTTERTKYLDAIVKLQVQTNGAASIFDKFSNLHGTLATNPPKFYIHGASQFLPVNCPLQKFDASIMLPYWGWQYVSQAPEKALLWGDNFYGGNGRSSDNCVITGRFKNWKPVYPTKGCLKRRWDAGARIGAFPSIEAVNRVLTTSKDYNAVREGIEFTLHGTPHINIGGHMSAMNSPNDPVFYLHHANVDKLWADWQKLKPAYATAYQGTNGCRGCTATANQEDILAGYNVKVKSVFNTATLCYRYEEANINAIPKTTAASLVRRGDPSPPEEESYGTTKEDSPPPKEDSPPPKTEDSPPKAQDSAPAEDQKPEATSSSPVKFTPYDRKVTSIPAPKDKDTGYVPDDDRMNLNYIRVPDPLTEEWLKLNSIDVKQCRKTEAYMRNETIYLNRVPGYVSPCALWNQPDLVQQLYTPGAKFYVELNGVRVIATSEEKDGLRAYEKIKERVEKSVNTKVQLPISEISAKVAAFIGPPLISDMNSILNPYAPRYKDDKGISREKVEEFAKNIPEIGKAIEKVSEKAVETITEIARESVDYKKKLRDGVNEVRKGSMVDIVKQAGQKLGDRLRRIRG